jgi:hypothetical protein
MGFFSDIGKGNISSAFGGDAAKGALAMFSPATAGAFALEQSGVFDDPFGVKAQADALREAGRIEEASQLEAMALQKQILGETAPFRELAREQIPFLREQAMQEPGTSQFFQRGLARGTQALQENLARFGLQDSSVGAVAAGELGAGLLSQDINRITGLRAGLAGQGTLGLGTSLGAQQLSGAAAARRAQTTAGIGGTIGAGRQAQTQALLDLLGIGLGAGITGFTGA